MADEVEQIKDRLDIVEVVGEYIKLDKAGVNYKALCPFHNEKEPSFIVSPSKQIWHCFGSCDEGGDVFSFIMKIEGLDFPEALQFLADKAGVKIKKESPRKRSQKQKLYDLYERAAQYFVKCLKAYKPAQDYLKKRGLKKETIKEWRLGYAPQKNKIKQRQLGMFRDRLMFPIRNISGQVVAFTGRKMPGNKGKMGKYINSPESLVYKKSSLLYGLSKAKQDIRKKDLAILVEGNLDVLSSWQLGVKEVVASSGSALSSQQLDLLKRQTKQLSLCFDMDEAGQKATQRTINLALEKELEVKIIQLPAGNKDIADILANEQKPVQEWQKAIKQAQPIMEYYFKQAFEEFDPGSVKNKKEAAKILLPKIAQIPNKIEQSHWLQKLGDKLGVEEKYLWQAMGSERNNQSHKNMDKQEASQQTEKKDRKDQLEERLAGLYFLQKEKETICKKSKRPKWLLYILQKHKSKEKELVLKLEQEGLEDSEIIKETQVCQRELQIIKLKEKSHQLSRKITSAEKKEDFEKAQALVQKFNKVCSQIQKIQHAQRKEKK